MSEKKFIFQWSESQSALTAEMWAAAFQPIGKTIGSNFQALLLNENRATTAYVNEEFVKLSEKHSEKFLQPGFREEFLGSAAEWRRQFEEFYEKFKKTDLKKAGESELAALLGEYHACLAGVGELFNYSQQEFTEWPKKFLQEKLRKHFGEKQVPEIISLLLSFDSFDLVKREEKELAELSLQEWDEAALERHSIKYAGLFYNSYDKQANLSFLRGRAEKFRAMGESGVKKIVGKMELGAEDVGRKQQKIFSQINDGRVREAATLLRDLGFDRFELKNYWAGAEYKFLQLFVEISRKSGVPLKELLGIYRIHEIEGLLLQGEALSREEAGSRKKAYLFYFKDGEIIFYSGEKALEKARQLVPSHFKQSDSREVRGNPANPGKARGVARVVKVIGVEELVKDIEAFRQGEVLVTTMTQPNMVPLAAKASAIVTDEGGVTSHAAVLAREFGIPCIVGTHAATRTFKTGDEIEVDAGKGSARLIRRGGKLEARQ